MRKRGEEACEGPRPQRGLWGQQFSFVFLWIFRRDVMV